MYFIVSNPVIPTHSVYIVQVPYGLMVRIPSIHSSSLGSNHSIKKLKCFSVNAFILTSTVVLPQ